MAVAAHFTARSEPAAVALPTGVGKTAVMTLLPYLLSAKRVLVIVPTRLLREQIVEEFANLTVLRQQRVVPKEVWSPKVMAVKKRPYNATWDLLRQRDVVASTPQSLISPDGGCLIPENFFDVAIFDEAHHTPAPIWDAIVERTRSARQVYFTATPYRRDERRLRATIAYEFSLKEAVDQGFVAPVDLRLIDDRGDVDGALIQEVQSLVKTETSPYFNVPFIARTNSKAHAHELFGKYDKAGLRALPILGDDSLRKARQNLDEVRNGSAAGLIMVGVLGEGFNFPAIKIAAYHRAHQSLPATLQFVGRVSRVHPGGPERALVLATRKEGADETSALYQKDAQWARLIPQLADQLFQREAKRALVERELLTPVQGIVAPSNLRPKRIVDIFVTSQDFDMIIDDNLDEDANVVQWWQTESRCFLVIIRKNEAAPRWLYEPVLIGTEFELQCAVYAPDEKLLFISSEGDSDAFARLLGLEPPRHLGPERLYAMLNGQGVEAYFNVGIRSIEVPNERRAAYMMNSGPSVAETIRAEDSATYTLGHAVAKIREDGRTRSFGIAIRKSRVWMAQSGSIADFFDWCMSLARLIHGSQPASMASGLQLRPEATFELFPEVGIAAIPGTRISADDATFSWEDGFGVHIADLQYQVQVAPDRKTCEVQASDGAEHSLRIQYNAAGDVEILTANVQLTIAGETVDMSQAFAEDPYRLFFGDGSSVRGFLKSSPADGVQAFPATHIETFDWERVDISKETYTEMPGMRSIFDYMHEQLAARYPNSVIVNDDRANELADIIVLTNRGAHVEVMLVHCKGAATRTERVSQLYVVGGQAQRSVRWALNRASFWSDLERRRRERAAFQVIHDPGGNAAEWLSQCAHTSPVTVFHIVVVQPGLLQSALRQGTPANVLLSSCKASAESAGAKFSVFCSG